MALKQWVIRVARWLATPWRRAKHRRYAEVPVDAASRLEFPNDKFLPLVRECVAKGETVIISVKGYSMRPFLEHLRDRVKLAPWTALSVGDAVLAEVSPDHFVLHRIIDIDGRQLTLMGDGNFVGTEQCSTGDIKAVVTHVIDADGRIHESNNRWRRWAAKVWRWLRPVRRYLLAIYNRLCG